MWKGRNTDSVRLRRIEDLDYNFEAKTVDEEEEMKAYCEVSHVRYNAA